MGKFTRTSSPLSPGLSTRTCSQRLDDDCACALNVEPASRATARIALPSNTRMLVDRRFIDSTSPGALVLDTQVRWENFRGTAAESATGPRVAQLFGLKD